MTGRRSPLVPLLAGCILAALLWFLVARYRSGETPDFIPSKPVAVEWTAPPLSRNENVPARTAKNDALRSVLAGELLAQLQRQLARGGARPNEGLLSFNDAEAYRKFLARAEQAGLTVLGQMDGLLTARVRYRSLSDLQNDILANAGDYEEVSGNYLVQIPPLPSQEDRAAINQVPFGNRLMAFLGANGDRSDWGRGSTIAVLDSGVGTDPTFSAGQVRYLDIGLGTAPGASTDDGHGTAVASLAVGSAADAQGVSPAANLLSIKVTGTDGTSDIFTLAQAILGAVDAGAQIINISMGGYQTSGALRHAIDYAVAHGAVIVAAAGNDQAAQLTWPAADPRVVSVGAVDLLEQQVLFSNSGAQLQMTAPGYGVPAAWLDGQRVSFDGTSASAPLVAGAIAAVMSQNPGLNAAQAWDILQQYASDAGAPGPDASYGNGILNLGWAMNRNDASRADTAIASHYYDAEKGEMQFVVQNRSGQTVAGLQLSVTAGTTTSTYSIPPLKAGAISIAKQRVDDAALAAAGRIEFRTQLVNPVGFADQLPANNRKASTLSAPDPDNRN